MEKEQILNCNEKFIFNIKTDNQYKTIISRNSDISSNILSKINNINNKYYLFEEIGSNEKISYELKEFMPISNDDNYVRHGLCSYNLYQYYGSFRDAKYKCPLMVNHVLDMSQKELTIFLKEKNINNCANPEMCDYYDIKQFMNNDNILGASKETLQNFAKNAIITMLKKIKEFRIKT